MKSFLAEKCRLVTSLVVNVRLYSKAVHSDQVCRSASLYSTLNALRSLTHDAVRFPKDIEYVIIPPFRLSARSAAMLGYLWLACLLLVPQVHSAQFLPPATRDAWPYKYLGRSCINTNCTAQRITLSNPPLNLWDANLVTEFHGWLRSLSDPEHEGTTPFVVVLSSDVPGFYTSSLDARLLGTSHDLPSTINTTQIVDYYYAGLAYLSELPVIFIGESNGRTWGGGNEHFMRFDMRFAGPDAIFGAPEAAIGLIHVGGLQWLVKAIGAGRAAEYLLSSAQVDATEAARVGWVNSAFSSFDDLRNYVDHLAMRIALFDRNTLAATKASIAEQAPSSEAYERDIGRFTRLAASAHTAEIVNEYLLLSKNQSRYYSLNLDDNIVGIYEG